MSNKQKCKLSLPQLIAEVATALILIGFAVVFFILYKKADDVIIRQSFNEYGYGNEYRVKKVSMIILFVISAVVYGIITFLQFYPKIWGEADNSSLKREMASTLRLMISTTKAIFVAVMFYITITALSANEVKDWILIVAIIVTVLEIAAFLTRFFILNKKSAEEI